MWVALYGLSCIITITLDRTIGNNQIIRKRPIEHMDQSTAQSRINRGSYMSAHVLLNLLNELGGGGEIK